MQISIIIVSLCGMALAAPGVKIIRSPHQIDELGRPVPQEGELPVGNPNLPEGGNTETNEVDGNLNVPENIDQLANEVAHNWNGQDLGPDILGDLGAVIP